MDFDPQDLFLCSWGDVPLFVSSLQWDAGNTQVTHDLAAGDFHPIQRRGAHLRKATAHLLFDDFYGSAETGIAAFRRFQATSKERRLFTHPVDGSFFAVIGALTPQIDEHSVVQASCEFLPDELVDAVAPAGSGTGSVSGETSVTAAADVVAEQLAKQHLGFPVEQLAKLDFSKPLDGNLAAAFSVDASVEIRTSVSVSASVSASASASVSASASASAFAFAGVYAEALAIAEASAVAQASGMAGASAFAFAVASAALSADAKASVASWTDEDASARKILTDATRLSDSISAMIDIGGLMASLDLWPAFRSALLLGESVRSAVVAATSETPTIFVMRHRGRPVALLTLCAKVYGGHDAQLRARQVASLNDIRTPGWLDPGDYMMPARPPTSSSALLDDQGA